MKFKTGDKVKKVKGYKFDGEVRTAFTNTRNEVRYVVEHQDGLLHIFNEEQLDFRIPLTKEKIIQEVSNVFDVTFEQMKTKSRKGVFVTARHFLSYFLRTMLKMQFKDIAKVLGGLDHSTVINSCNRVENLLSVRDEVYLDYYNKIYEKLK